MKAADIIARMVQLLPFYTDSFTPQVDITSLTRSGTTVTATTDVAHGLTTADLIVITGAKSPIEIVAMTQVDGIAVAHLASNTDITVGWQGQSPSDNVTVEIADTTEPEYNGTHELLTSPNRREITFAVDSGAPIPATGSPKLLQDLVLGYNGQHQITVTGPTTFTYEITETPGSPAQGTIKVSKGSRVSGVVDLAAAISSYTVQSSGDLWAYVVLGDTIANKDRRDDTDATFTQAAGTDFRQRIISPFNIYVFVPASGEIAGRAARDQMQDVRTALFKVILRAIFGSGLSVNEVFTTVYTGDGFVAYDGAKYIHQFSFEEVADITNADTSDPDYNVAFRDIALEFNDELGTTELSVTVNLDDQPLP